MSKLDQLIAEALAEEARETGEPVEPAFLGQALGLFRGRNAWVWTLTAVFQTLFFVIGIWAAWQFFTTSDLLMALRYGISSAVLILMATAMKFSMMPVIEANRVIREIRRAELQRLVGQQAGQD
jgi:hypothetical protein